METANLVIDNNEISLGIAMPPQESGLNEILINASIPLPYGFLTFTLGRNGIQMCDFVVNGPFQPAPTCMPHDRMCHRKYRIHISGLRAQMCGSSGGGSMVTNPTAANTTISSKSVLLADQLQIVSRIQSPIFAEQDLFMAPSSVLQVTISENAPFYLDSANETALLNLTNSESTNFVFNRTAGLFANYTQMVAELGL